MKKRIASLFLAFVMLVCAMSVASFAYAANKKEVFAHYSANGKYKVSSFEFTLNENDFTYKVWYPKDIKKMSKRPVILYCNGTGSNYTMQNNTAGFLSKAASYGYIALTNTDKDCGTGASMDAGMTKLIALSKDSKSRLYGKVDLSRVGLAGHSQGAACTVNLSDPEKYANARYYKAIYAASIPTNAIEEMQNCPYDTTKVKVPTCLVAGTGMTDSKFICPIDTSLKPNFRNIQSDVYMARMKDVEHAGSFETMHPYMLAWFDYRFYGDEFAAKAFTGAAPELKANPEWQDFNYKLTKKSIKLKTAKGKKAALYAKWAKVNTANGYKLEYSKSKSFRNKKTVTVKGAKSVKKTVKKLKKGKYYVRVRAYTKVGKKTHYSTYSAVKTVKVK